MQAGLDFIALGQQPGAISRMSDTVLLLGRKRVNPYSDILLKTHIW